VSGMDGLEVNDKRAREYRSKAAALLVEEYPDGTVDLL
jgi:hypothetical protein